MKKLFLVSAVVSLAISGALFTYKANASFESEVIADGAVAHWNFEETSGNVIDQIGAVDGALLGAPDRQQSAVMGNGYNFDAAATEGITLPDSAFDSHTEGAIEAIVQVDSASTGPHIIFAQGDSAATGGYQVLLYIENGRVTFHVRPDTGSPNKISGGTVLNPGQYYHIVAQMSDTGMQLFINGVEDTPYTVEGDQNINWWFSDNAALTTTNSYGIGYLNRGSPTGYFDGIIDEVALYDAPKAQSVWASHHSAAFDTVTDGLSISSPSVYQIYQRDGSSQADITIEGTYTGTPTAIEYQIDGGTWNALDSTLAGGTFSGTASDVSAGEHTITVRLANETATTDSVTNVRVGDVFGWIGQSNQDGRFIDAQPYTGAAASVFDQDGSWENLTSGYLSPDASGRYSVLPRLASLIEADTGVPVGFVAETLGGTGLIAPDDEWAQGGANYTNFINTVNSSDINDLKALLWYQGGHEVHYPVSQSTYETAEQTMLNNMQADTGFSAVPMISANIAMQGGRDTAAIDTVRAAKIANWENVAEIYPGPTGHDQDFSDGLHWRTDAQAATLAGRWSRTIDNALYSGSEAARGPQFNSASYEGNSLTVTFAGGEGSLTNQTDTTGWEVSDDAGTRTVQSATGTSNTVTLTLDQALTGTVTVSFASGNAAVGTTLVDSGTHSMPPEPFVDETALASVPTNTAPTASDDSSATSEDTDVTSDVLANDTDADSDTLSVTTATDGSNGATVVNGDDTITYTPNVNFSGSDSYSYTVSDGNGGTDTATVTVTVSAANDAPVITGTPATSVDEGIAYSFTPTGSDVENDTLTYSIVNMPAWASFSTTTGELSGTPSTSDAGTYTDIEIAVSDGNGGSDALAAFTLTVNDIDTNQPPAISSNGGGATASLAADENQTAVTTVTSSDPNEDTLVYSLTGGADQAAFSINSTSGVLTFNTAPNFENPTDSNTDGVYEVTAQVSDGNGGTDSQAMSVTITNVNEAPVAANDNASTSEDTAATMDVVANDSDVDGDTVSVTAATDGSDGTTVVNGDDSITYTPSANFNGSDSYSYTVSDGNGGSDTATVTVTVTPVNDAPTITGTPATSADEGIAYSFTPAGTDVDDDTLTYSASNLPAWTSFNTTTGELSGTPASGDVGDYADIQVGVADGNGGNDALAAFTLTVNGSDGDGIPAAEENAAPNAGDGNNDGFADSAQDNVASFANTQNSNQYVTVVVDSTCQLSDVSVVSESTEHPDPAHEYQAGLIDFTADCGTNGFTTDVSLYFYGTDATDKIVRKYNPNTNSYVALTSASLSTQFIAGEAAAVVSYSVTDGGDLDIDGIVNGTIVDPVGLATAIGAPGSSATGSGNGALAPNTGLLTANLAPHAIAVAGGIIALLSLVLPKVRRRLSTLRH